MSHTRSNADSPINTVPSHETINRLKTSNSNKKGTMVLLQDKHPNSQWFQRISGYIQEHIQDKQV